MKKTVISVLSTLVFGVTVSAQSSDTIVNFNRKTIEIHDSIDKIVVQIFNSSEQPYSKIYEGIFTETKTYEQWSVYEEIGIHFPVFSKFKKKKDNRKYKPMEAHSTGIGWGFANISNKNLKFNNIEGISLKEEASCEFFFSIFPSAILPFYRDVFGISTSLGFDWHNYYFDTNKHLLEYDGVVGVYDAPEGILYKKNRLRTFGLSVPLLLEWQPHLGKNHNFFMAAGIVGEVNLFSSFRVKYTAPTGGTVNFAESKGLNLAPLTMSYMAQIGYKSLSIYTKYSPFSIFQSEKGPKIQAVSLGAMLHF